MKVVRIGYGFVEIDALNLTYTGTSTVDLELEYEYIPLLKLDHYAFEGLNSTVQVRFGEYTKNVPMVQGVDYNFTGVNNNFVIFYTFNTSIYATYSFEEKYSYYLQYSGYLT
ncbi:unnamed protein product, partial [marine sediment metagenome]